MDVTYCACLKCDRLNTVAARPPEGRVPVCGHCGTDLPVHGGVSEAGPGGLRELAQKSPLPVVVDFWAPWCGPCRAFAPAFSEVAGKMAGRAVFAKVNTEAYPAAAEEHGVRGIPTLAVFHEGRELARQSGAMSAPMFAVWLQSLLAQAR